MHKPKEALNYRIGQAALASGLTAASIRFYEQQGLLGTATRSENGYRMYGPGEVARLRQIRVCRSLDMSLAETQRLLDSLSSAAPDCAQTTTVLKEHLGHVEQRLEELEQLAQQLRQWLAMCAHAPESDCPTQDAIRRLQVNAVADAQPTSRRHV